MSDEITEEQIAQNYTAMGHSVDLLNAGKPVKWQTNGLQPKLVT